jgi:DNA repair protein RecO (recombination protein O)
VKIALQPAYVLHSRPYRDTSLLLEVFTAEHGRLGLVARGARRKSRGGSGGALLQPFTPLLLSFTGRAELKTLTAVEAAGLAQVLQGDRLFSGMYLNELLVRLLHRHDPNPTLFAAYSAALQSLAAEADVEVSLRRFELRLLEELGYSFDLAAEGDTGEAVQEDRWYQYHSHCGLVAGDGIAEPSTPAFSGSDLLRMARGQFGGEVRQTAKRLLRLALSEHLGGAPLRSRELFSHGASPSTGGDRDISGH